MCKYFFKFFLLYFFLAGCAVTAPAVSQTKIMELSRLLYALDTNIPQDEAIRLSRDIFHETQKLTKEFELTSPPVFHNFLVNIGIRKKGLCYHWSDALYMHFLQKKYPHFEFHLLGANIGKYFSEHNALVVVSKKGEVLDGVLIDPWRNSGKLYFSKVGKDKKYQWKHREERGCLR
jgi:hypothetical protein